MKIDLYTKIILTGIFACLCLIVFRDVRLEKTAEAGNFSGTQDVNIVGIDKYVFKYTKYPLPVKIEEWNAGDLDVDIDDCFNCQ